MRRVHTGGGGAWEACDGRWGALLRCAALRTWQLRWIAACVKQQPFCLDLGSPIHPTSVLTHPRIRTPFLSFSRPGKTMLAKAVAHHTTASFIRVVGSEFVQKYLGEVRAALPAVCAALRCAMLNCPERVRMAGSRPARSTMLWCLLRLCFAEPAGAAGCISRRLRQAHAQGSPPSIARHRTAHKCCCSRCHTTSADEQSC